MKFSDVLASSVHDIKNSLNMVLHTLDSLMHDPATQIGDQNKANVLRLETQRANANLIQLLSLYKLEKEQLVVDIVEQNVADFLEELVAENSELMHSLGIELECRCDPWLSGYFDDGLVRGVLNSVIGNAERYTKDRIMLCAAEVDGFLVLRVADNGEGFPEHMLQHGSGKTIDDNFATGHTQLGLFFASQVAQLHQAGDKTGRIEMHNGCTLDGGCFELWLP